MTPEERAEKILNEMHGTLVLSGEGPQTGHLRCVLVCEIRAAVVAALQSADVSCRKCKRAHAYLCNECFDGEKKAAVEEAGHTRCKDFDEEVIGDIWKAKAEAYEEGRQAAFLDAAKYFDEQGQFASADSAAACKAYAEHFRTLAKEQNNV